MEVLSLLSTQIHSFKQRFHVASAIKLVHEWMEQDVWQHISKEASQSLAVPIFSFKIVKSVH